jgi:hypothetical protein
MPQDKNSGAWPSNPQPKDIPEVKEGSVDIDDRDEGYQVSPPNGGDGDDDTLAAPGDDEDTLDLEEEGDDESEDEPGYQASEPPRVPAPAPSPPAKKPR